MNDTRLQHMAVTRANLPRPIPERLVRRPLDEEGTPVAFYDAAGSKGEGRGSKAEEAVDVDKVRACVRDRRCSLCGDRLGVHLALVVSAGEAVRRATGFLPAHLECAEWWGRSGEGLRAEGWGLREQDEGRRTKDEGDEGDGGGAPSTFDGRPATAAICAVWVTRDVHVNWSADGAVAPVANFGVPEAVLWFCAGRSATREEVATAIVATAIVAAAVGLLSGCPEEMAEEIYQEFLGSLEAKMLALRRWMPGEGMSDGGTRIPESGEGAADADLRKEGR